MGDESKSEDPSTFDVAVILTVVGTSVAAFALLTYRSLTGSPLNVMVSTVEETHLHPSFALFRDDFEAEDTIFGEVHVTLCDE